MVYEKRDNPQLYKMKMSVYLSLPNDRCDACKGHVCYKDISEPYARLRKRLMHNSCYEHKKKRLRETMEKLKV